MATEGGETFKILRQTKLKDKNHLGKKPLDGVPRKFYKNYKENNSCFTQIDNLPIHGD